MTPGHERVEFEVRKGNVALVIDTSGSMEPLINEVRSGVNGFLTDQRRNGHASLHITEFDTAVREVYTGTLDDAPTIDSSYFKASGLTALYDAIGNAITTTDAVVPDAGRMHSSIAPIVVIFTDGTDNSSIQFDAHRICRLISDRKERGWSFLFFGCSQDAALAGGRLGIDTITYAATPASQAEVYRTASAMVTRTRTAPDPYLPN